MSLNLLNPLETKTANQVTEVDRISSPIPASGETTGDTGNDFSLRSFDFGNGLVGALGGPVFFWTA